MGLRPSFIPSYLNFPIKARHALTRVKIHEIVGKWKEVLYFKMDENANGGNG